MYSTDTVDCTVLGATGVVGQRFVERLALHPRLRLLHVASSDRTAGQRYEEAAPWRLESPAHGGLGALVLRRATPEHAFAPVVFSALPGDVAGETEAAFARAGALVFSNAAAHRMDADVPLLVPEVNPAHLGLVAAQRAARGWRGAITCNPNCTASVLVMALAPLHAAFGIEAVAMTSLQALSGAGWPGVPGLDALGNVIPYIAAEEQKVEEETPRMLGRLDGARVVPAPFVISAQCNRVPVIDGHSESVSLRLAGDPSPETVREALLDWRPEIAALGLPSAPTPPLRVHDAPDRPQPRLDVARDSGMSVHVGRIRRCPLLGIKLALLGHNTQRGAAGGSLLNAELSLAKGLLA